MQPHKYYVNLTGEYQQLMGITSKVNFVVASQIKEILSPRFCLCGTEIAARWGVSCGALLHWKFRRF